MIDREYNKRRYDNGIVGFELKLVWSDGRTEVVDEMPEYLQNELELFCEEYDQYRNENEKDYL